MISKNQHVLYGLVWMFLFSIPSLGQDVESAKNELSSAGFEQVIFVPVQKIGDETGYKLGVEHRSINNPFDVILLADRICKKHGLNRVRITLFRKGQVIYESEVSGGVSIASDFLSDSYLKDFNRLFAPSNYRFNLFFTPDVKVRFGNFENPLQSKISMLLMTELVLFRGFSLVSGLSFPVENDLDSQMQSVSLSTTYLDYFAQPWKGHFFQFSSGLFTNNRYGLDFQYRNFKPNQRLSFGFRYALTGFYFFPTGSIFFESEADRMYLGDVEYLFPTQRVSLSLMGGQFLFKDRGVRAELLKQYRTMELGFFASKTTSGSNAGFKIMVALFPGKLVRTKMFELRTDEAFRWEYGYSNEGLVAGNFRSGPLLQERLRRYTNTLFKHY
jgi:hypothetical protein